MDGHHLWPTHFVGTVEGYFAWIPHPLEHEADEAWRSWSSLQEQNLLESSGRGMYNLVRFNCRIYTWYWYVMSIHISLKRDRYLSGWSNFLWSLLFLPPFGFPNTCRVCLVLVIIWFLQLEQILKSTNSLVDLSSKTITECIFFFHTTSGLETGISFKTGAFPLGSS